MTKKPTQSDLNKMAEKCAVLFLPLPSFKQERDWQPGWYYVNQGIGVGPFSTADRATSAAEINGLQVTMTVPRQFSAKLHGKLHGAIPAKSK